MHKKDALDVAQAALNFTEGLRYKNSVFDACNANIHLSGKHQLTKPGEAVIGLNSGLRKAVRSDFCPTSLATVHTNLTASKTIGSGRSRLSSLIMRRLAIWFTMLPISIRMGVS